MMVISLYDSATEAKMGARFLGAAAMETLVLAIQVLSFALLLFGAWLCASFVHGEQADSKTANAASVPAEEPESDLHHGTPA